jgi:Cu/Ag efflux protein CusF
VAFQAAVLAGGIALFGALGVGAAAATGTAPEPVRTIFRLTSSSPNSIEFTGVITGIDLDTGTLEVDEGGEVRTVRVTASTKFLRGGDAIGLDDLKAGNGVEVKGTRQADHSILAKRVHLKGADAAGTPGAGAVDTTPEAPPDHDDGDDETRTPKATRTPDADDDDSAKTRTPDADREDINGRGGRGSGEEDASAHEGVVQDLRSGQERKHENGRRHETHPGKARWTAIRTA